MICKGIVWPIDGTLSGTTTSSQSGPGSNGNEGGLHISQSDSPSDSLVSFSGHSLGVSYPSTEMQLLYSTAPVDWAGCVCVCVYVERERTRKKERKRQTDRQTWQNSKIDRSIYLFIVPN